MFVLRAPCYPVGMLNSMARTLVVITAFANCGGQKDQTTSCNDGERGTQETGIDCGGNCGGCAADEACIVDNDCLSNSCESGLCMSSELSRIVTSDAWSRNEQLLLGLFNTSPSNTQIGSYTSLMRLSDEQRGQVLAQYNNASNAVMVLSQHDRSKIDFGSDGKHIFRYVEYRRTVDANPQIATLPQIRQILTEASSEERQLFSGNLYVRYVEDLTNPPQVAQVGRDKMIAKYPAETTPSLGQCRVTETLADVAGIMSNVSCLYNHNKDGDYRAAIGEYLDKHVVNAGTIQSYHFPSVGSDAPIITLVPVDPKYTNALREYDLRFSDLELIALGAPVQTGFATKILQSNRWFLQPSPDLSGLFLVLGSTDSPGIYSYQSISEIVRLLASAKRGDPDPLLEVLVLLGEDVTALRDQTATPMFFTTPTVSSAADSSEPLTPVIPGEEYYRIGSSLTLTPMTNRVVYWHGYAEWDDEASERLEILAKMFPGHVVTNNALAYSPGLRAAEALVHWMKDPTVQVMYVDGHSYFDPGPQGVAFHMVADHWSWTPDTASRFDECVARSDEYDLLFPEYAAADVFRMQYVPYNTENDVLEDDIAQCGILVNMTKLTAAVAELAPHKKALLMLDTCRAHGVGLFNSTVFANVAGASGFDLVWVDTLDLTRLQKWVTEPDQLAVLENRDRMYLGDFGGALSHTLSRNTPEYATYTAARDEGKATGKLALWRQFIGSKLIEPFPRIRGIRPNVLALELEFSSLVERANILVHRYDAAGAPLPADPNAIIVNIPEQCEKFPGKIPGVVDVKWVNELEMMTVDDVEYATTLHIIGTHGQLGPQQAVCDELAAYPSAAMQETNDRHQRFAAEVEESTAYIEVLVPALKAPNGTRLHGNQTTMFENRWVHDRTQVDVVRDPTCTDPACAELHRCTRPDWMTWTATDSEFHVKVPCFPPPAIKSITSSQPGGDETYRALRMDFSQPVTAQEPLVHILSSSQQPQSDPHRVVVNVPDTCKGAGQTTVNWGASAGNIDGISSARALTIDGPTHIRRFPNAEESCFADSETAQAVFEDKLADIASTLDQPKIVVNVPELRGRADTFLQQGSFFLPDIGAYEHYTPGFDDTLHCTAPWWRIPFLDFGFNGPISMEIPCVEAVLPDGSSTDKAAASCQAIKSSYPDSSDGLYWLDPDGAGKIGPLRAHCDMTVEGGGWTVVNPDPFFRKFGRDDEPERWQSHFGSVFSSVRSVKMPEVPPERASFGVGGCRKSTFEFFSLLAQLGLSPEQVQFRLSYGCESVTRPGENKVYRIRLNDAQERILYEASPIATESSPDCDANKFQGAVYPVSNYGCFAYRISP